MVLNSKDFYSIEDNNLINGKHIKFNYLSDIHINYYYQYPTKKEEILNFFKKILLNSFDDKSEILIVAGDLGEDNELTVLLLEALNELYKYVIFVIGNHDLYIKNRIQEDDYENNSFNKIKELKSKVSDYKNIFFLDGGILSINGIKIGGTMGWYDGSYIYRYKNNYYTMNDKLINKSWQGFIDWKYIKGIKDFKHLHKLEEPKILELVKEVNIMITHILPSNNANHINKIYLREPLESMTPFFCFNFLEKFTDKINNDLKFWIYGHSHSGLNFDFNNIKVLNNCLGGVQESNYGSSAVFKNFDYEI